MTWEEVSKAKADNRRELVLSGKLLTARIEEAGGTVDPALFSLSGLNFLDLNSSPALISVPVALGGLTNLTTLMLNRNALTELPGPALAKLTKLKVVDVSGNKLTSLPAELTSMNTLSTLNASMNALTSIEPLSAMTALSHINLSSNQLEDMAFLCHTSLALLAEVNLSKNKIAVLEPSISSLAALKNFDMSENLLKTIPGELADCIRIKELQMNGNPFAENRLKKLVAQKGAKSVLDYVRQNCPRAEGGSGGGAGGGGGKKGKGKKGKKGKAAPVEEEEELSDLLEVLHMRDDSPLVVVEDITKEVRPYIVCCIVRDLDLTDGKFKKFIQMQTKLHDTVCEKRLAATIATHDLAKIPSGKVTYTAVPPSELLIAPLGKTKEFSADKLVQHLRDDAEALRKEKKRNTISGVHQYLNLLKDKEVYPCLKNDTGSVISFPPITNADGSKISEATKDILVEVTSSTKLQAAKTACDRLLREMLLLELGSKAEEDEGDGYRQLKVEQMKLEDSEGNMKVVYPSKLDLEFEEAAKIKVIRP